MSSDSDDPIELRTTKMKSEVTKGLDEEDLKGESKGLKTERTAREKSPLIKDENS